MPTDESQKDAEESMRRWFPEAFKADDEKKKTALESISVFPRCHECNARLKREHIYRHLYGESYFCEECGDRNYV